MDAVLLYKIPETQVKDNACAFGDIPSWIYRISVALSMPYGLCPQQAEHIDVHAGLPILWMIRG